MDYIQQLKDGKIKLYDIPEEDHTDEIYLEAVTIDGFELANVPEEKRTFEICKIACKNDGNALDYVPLELPQYEELCEIAVRNSAFALEFVPLEKRTVKLCEIAVTKMGNTLKYVPLENRTDELLRLSVQKDGRGLQFISPELPQYEELCRIALRKNGMMLKFIPLEKRTDELCEIAVNKNADAIQYVPLEKRTDKDELLRSIEKDGSGLQFISPELPQYEELCRIALRKNGMMLKFTPLEKRTDELCEIAVNNNGDAIQYVPEEKRTDELCEIAVIKNGDNIEYVPEEKRNNLYELALKTISKSAALRFIPKVFRLRGREKYHEQVKRNATDLALQTASELPHSDNIFDIIVFVRSHGLCPEPCKVLDCIVKIPETVKVSVMRSSNYGVVTLAMCNYSLDPTWVRKLIPDIMEQNNSKEAVFGGIQKAFRYIKNDHIEHWTSDLVITKPSKLAIEDPGYSFKIDHTKYINSIYDGSAHDDFILIHIVYFDPSIKTQLNPYHLTSLKNLQTLINHLNSCGFKNIGIIEQICHSFSEVCNPDEIAKAQEMNDMNGIYGGKRKKRTRKRKGTQRKRLRRTSKR